MSPDCIFCKIISGEIPSSYIVETDHVVVIKDISPKAPIHYLIVPKKHIQNMHELSDSDAFIAGQMATVARDLARKTHNDIDFNIIVNNGAKAGQTVFHMHWHFLSGRNICHEIL